jgi:DNA-binding phage protein
VNHNVIHFTSSEAVHRDFMVWYTVAMTVTGGDVPLNRLGPTTRLGMTVTYTANSVAYTMLAYAEKLLTAHGMQDCNPASTLLPPGFHMVKADQPDTAEDRAAVTAFMNKVFGRNDHSYADTVSSFASSMQGMNWFATMVSPGLRTAISLTACASHNPSIKAIKVVKQMLL